MLEMSDRRPNPLNIRAMEKAKVNVVELPLQKLSPMNGCPPPLKSDTKRFREMSISVKQKT